MRSDECQIPTAPGTVAVGRTRWTPGGPTAPAADAGTPAADAAGPASAATPRSRPRSPRGAPRAGCCDSPRSRVPWLLLSCAPEALGQIGKLPDAKISEIRFEGNATIPPEKIKNKLLSKVGQPFDIQKIDADVKTLMKTNWFSQVEAYHDEQPPKSGKYVLIFAVREMPVLTYVEFRGRKAVRLKDIEDNTGLKKGSRADYHAHPQRGALDLPALPGEGLRPGGGRAARGGQSRRHQGGDADLRGAQGQDRQHRLHRLPVRHAGDAARPTSPPASRSSASSAGTTRTCSMRTGRSWSTTTRGRASSRCKVTPVTRPGKNARRDRPHVRHPRGDAVLGPQGDHPGEQQAQDRQADG